jgi:hypothetical protein
MPNKTFTLSSQAYLDYRGDSYTNIVTVNCIPDGPLKDRVVKVNLRPLSKFQSSSEFFAPTTCGLGIRSSRSRIGIVTIDELDDLLSYLADNQYSPNHILTSMLQEHGSNTKQTIGMFQYEVDS